MSCSQIDVPSIAEFVFSLTDLIVLPIRVALSFELLRHEVLIISSFTKRFHLFGFQGWGIRYGGATLSGRCCNYHYGPRNSKWLSQSSVSGKTCTVSPEIAIS